MSIHEIRVINTEGDPKGEEVFHEVRQTLGVPNLEGVQTAHVYRVEGATPEQSDHLARKLLADPVDQVFAIDSPVLESPTVEVAYKPGVMNPGVESIIKAAAMLGVELSAADLSTEYKFIGDITPEEARLITERLLVNKNVHRVVDKKPETLIIHGEAPPVRQVQVLGQSPEALNEMSKKLKLYMSQDEMGATQEYFSGRERDPYDAEIQIIAGWVSEHCGHKTFKSELGVRDANGEIKIKAPMYARLQIAARRNFDEDVISAFEDNSGVARFYDGQAINAKVETHNSPSAIEPYGGSETGVGGDDRDVMGTGQGGKVILSTDMFCFAPMDIDLNTLPKGTLTPDYLQRRVVAGVRDYGNRMGIPTANGSIHYHPDFRAKPSVIVGAYGILPEERARKGKAEVGDFVVVIGGKTGRDGINGATFSSVDMTDQTMEVNSTAVQIGNAIEEKRVQDAILEARDNDTIRALTDCGAAGFSSAIGEMGEGIGFEVDISRAPLKYQGLAPWEIWMSESQERMVLAVDPKKYAEFEAICKKYNVESTVLGNFDGSGRFKVRYEDQEVADLDYEFLTDGMPKKVLEVAYEKEIFEEHEIPEPEDWDEAIKKVLSDLNVCSKEYVVRQYDHTVQGTNVLPPFGGVNYDGPNDAAVITPIYGKPYGLVQAHGMNPILNRIDPYEGSLWAIAEAMANYVSAGGNPDRAYFVNNYIWPTPDDPVTLGSLDRSVDAVCDAMDALGRPVISGKDSLSSTYRGDDTVIKIPPVLCMSVFGKIPDVAQTMSTDIKKPGESRLYLVGARSDNMGGSVYYANHGMIGNEGPKIDMTQLPGVLRSVHNAIKSGQVLACHDISQGGVVTALAEMSFGGDCGVEITLDEEVGRADFFLMNETAGTFVIELDQDTDPTEIFGEVPVIALGSTTSEKKLTIRQGEKKLVDSNMDELKTAWQAPLKERFY